NIAVRSAKGKTLLLAVPIKLPSARAIRQRRPRRRIVLIPIQLTLQRFDGSVRIVRIHILPSQWLRWDFHFLDDRLRRIFATRAAGEIDAAGCQYHRQQSEHAETFHRSSSSSSCAAAPRELRAQGAGERRSRAVGGGFSVSFCTGGGKGALG